MTTNDLIKKLNDGVEALFDSDKYRDYMRFLATFRQYSTRNCILIMRQLPYASFVASFSDWKNKHGRIVRRGEKAIRILAPHTCTGKDGDGNDVVYTGFHIASCFDISQTDPIPGRSDAGHPDILCPCRAGLTGSDAALPAVLIGALAPVPVRYAPIRGYRIHGFYNAKRGEIVISSAIKGTSQEVSTIIHECAHAWLHGTDGPEREADRATREVQAQSVAYVVSEYLGVDTSGYSFGYVGAWSKDRSHKELTDSLDVIRRTAGAMIAKIEAARELSAA